MARAFLYAAAFLCGGCVLVIELIASRLMAPFYGASLLVWTAIIGVTLGALALGYALGGHLADRMVARGRTMTGLAILLTAAACATAIEPALGPPVMRAMSGAGLVGGTILSAAVLLTPPLGALGMVSPYVIRALTTEVARAGRVAGRVFALSTLGSILAAFLTGLVLAPGLGVRWTFFATAAILAILALVAVFLRGRPIGAVAVAAALALFFAPAAQGLHRPVPVTIGDWEILHVSEGLTGQIKVVDRARSVRFLLLDGIYQTARDLRTGASRFAYVHVVCAGISGRVPPGGRVLVVGIGGGMIPAMLAKMGYRVTAVDYDPRMPPVARRFFEMPDEVEAVVADGRWFLERAREGTYDAVVLDAFTGEREPLHLLTREAVARAAALLKPDGMLVLNVLMYVNLPPQEGRAFAGVMRTIAAAGLDARAFATRPAQNAADEETRNILIFAVPAGARRWEPVLGGAVSALGDAAAQCAADFRAAVEVFPKEFRDPPAPVFTDDRSGLDVLNRRYNEAWRRGQMGAVPAEVLAY